MCTYKSDLFILQYTHSHTDAYAHTLIRAKLLAFEEHISILFLGLWSLIHTHALNGEYYHRMAGSGYIVYCIVCAYCICVCFSSRWEEFLTSSHFTFFNIRLNISLLIELIKRITLMNYFVFFQYNEELHYVEPCLNGTLVQADVTNKDVSLFFLSFSYCLSSIVFFCLFFCDWGFAGSEN